MFRTPHSGLQDGFFSIVEYGMARGEGGMSGLRLAGLLVSWEMDVISMEDPYPWTHEEQIGGNDASGTSGDNKMSWWGNVGILKGGDSLNTNDQYCDLQVQQRYPRGWGGRLTLIRS